MKKVVKPRERVKNMENWGIEQKEEKVGTREKKG